MPGEKGCGAGKDLGRSLIPVIGIGQRHHFQPDPIETDAQQPGHLFGIVVIAALTDQSRTKPIHHCGMPSIARRTFLLAQRPGFTPKGAHCRQAARRTDRIVEISAGQRVRLVGGIRR